MEAVKTAELYLEVDRRLAGNESPKDIDTLVKKVIELSGGTEDEYIIIYGKIEQLASISQNIQKTQVLAKKMQQSQTRTNEIQQVTIIHKKTGVVIEITIDENNSVTVEGRIDEDVIKREIPTVEYSINPSEETKASEVTITITAKEGKNGITKIKFPNNTEKTYSNLKTVTETYKVTENERYKFEVTGADGTKVVKFVEVKNVNSAGDISITMQETQPTNRSVNVVIRYDENPTVNGQLLTNADKYQYRLGDGNWATATTNPITILVEENCNVYARYYNGSTGYKTQTISVGNIDKIAPDPFAFQVATTSNSITISGTTQDAASEGAAASTAGIKGYQYRIDDGEWLPGEPTQEPSYVFTNFVTGSTHTVNMRAIDKAGNAREATNSGVSVTLK